MFINPLKIKKILLWFGLYPFSNLINKGRFIPILRYHSIADKEHNAFVNTNITLPEDLFESQIKYLIKNYNIVSMDVVSECFLSGRLFPKKAVVVTFDDGYRDNYTAYKILKKYKISGTFYVVAGCIGGGEALWLFEILYLIRNTKKKSIELEVSGKYITKPIETSEEKIIFTRKITEIIKSNNLTVREDVRNQLRSQLSDVTGLERRASQIMLTWEHLREMSNNGMIIGGHTLTHLNLPNAEPEDARREIYECKHLLEEKLQKPVLHFSYPNGGNYQYYNESIMHMVKEAGYLTSTTSNNGLADLTANEYELRRIRVTQNIAEIYYQVELEILVERLLKKLVYNDSTPVKNSLNSSYRI